MLAVLDVCCIWHCAHPLAEMAFAGASLSFAECCEQSCHSLGYIDIIGNTSRMMQPCASRAAGRTQDQLISEGAHLDPSAKHDLC